MLAEVDDRIVVAPVLVIVRPVDAPLNLKFSAADVVIVAPAREMRNDVDRAPFMVKATPTVVTDAATAIVTESPVETKLTMFCAVRVEPP